MYFFYFAVIRGLMLGKMMNAPHFGMIFAVSRCLTEIFIDFHSNDGEYFLEPIVVFSNDYKKLEIIDGQQRLISILLLLRAFMRT